MSRMGCNDLRELLFPFVDGELSVEQNVAVLKHLEFCATCSAHVARERQLSETVAKAATQAAPADLLERLVGGAAERVDLEDRRGRLRTRWLAGAAATLVALGLGFVTFDPLCLRGCPNMKIAAAALDDTEGLEPLSLDELRSAFPRPLDVPRACGVRVEGGYLVHTPGVPERPMLAMRCKRSGQRFFLLRVPGQHRHSWVERQANDGRPYFASKSKKGVRLVGWHDESGLWLCLARGEGREGSLATLAAAIRDALG